MDKPWVYLVLLGFVIILVARMLPRRTKSPANPTVQEIEETLEHFAAEIEEDNKELLQAVAQMKQEHEQQVARLTGRIDFLEKQSYDLTQEVKSMVLLAMKQQMAGQVPTQPAGSEPAAPQTGPKASVQSAQAPGTDSPMQMKTRYAELFGLFDQGKSVEAIARKLGMNKGEVNLIIQLAKQEEQSRV